MLFAVVGMAERSPNVAVGEEVLRDWQSALPAHQDERALHAELLAALGHAHAVPSAVAADVLDKCRRYLAGLPVAHGTPRRQAGRRVRNRGVH